MFHFTFNRKTECVQKESNKTQYILERYLVLS